MSDLRSLLHEAGSAPGGTTSMVDRHASVRHRIKRRRAVRASGIGSAAAVSVGALALGVAQVLPGKPQEAGPASAVEAPAPASADEEATSDATASPAPSPSEAPSSSPEAVQTSPSPDAGNDNIHMWGAPPGTLYVQEDTETGVVHTTLIPGSEDGTAVLVHADNSQELLELTAAGTYAFSDVAYDDGTTLWVTVTPDGQGAPDTIEVLHGSPEPEGELSVRTPLD